MDQRAEEVVQPDERLAHAGPQVDAVVEGAALAALVALRCCQDLCQEPTPPAPVASARPGRSGRRVAC